MDAHTPVHASVAALFVQYDGFYPAQPDVDPWPEWRDARGYDGTLPVVAHPPCATWGRYSHKAGGKGNDGGCFAAALAAVRRCGGVIEHPAGSAAWPAHGLPGPLGGHDDHGGWTLYVLQWWWGHEALKATWLYVVGCEEVALTVQPASPRMARPLEDMGRRARSATPPRFGRFLIDLAARCRREH